MMVSPGFSGWSNSRSDDSAAVVDHLSLLAGGAFLMTASRREYSGLYF
jgi:hypothetical protein